MRPTVTELSCFPFFFPKHCPFRAACGELNKDLTFLNSLTWFMHRFRGVFRGLLFIFKELASPNHILPSGLWEVMGKEKEVSAFPVSCYLVLFMDAGLTIH